MSLTALQVVTPASVEPLSVAEAKSHLRITHTLEDELIEGYIQAAINWASEEMRRVLIDTEVRYSFDRFPDKGEAIWLRGDYREDYYYVPLSSHGRLVTSNARQRAMTLPGGKVTAVNSIDYVDPEGVTQTLSGPTSGTPGTDYQEDLPDDEWPQVFPPVESEWPRTRSGLVNAVQVRYQVGWADETELPAVIKHAIKFKVADLYNTRYSEEKKGPHQKAAEQLLFPYVLHEV